MVLPARVRKAVLTTHIATSVGWLGAVVAYLTLDLTATLSRDIENVRAAYLAMAALLDLAIVPLALGSVLIGIVNALGTTWGLLRHYWVLVKLLLTVLATTVLLLEAPTVDQVARLAVSQPDPRELPSTLLHSVGGIVVLLAITILSVYKPRGLTRHGWRAQRKRQNRAGTARQVSAGRAT